mmetsp:Transcript_46273/g.122791  ORF Transcript_46273/g.122791 Transcript_46273/m.122791 type:complete len:251 (-) Transcript_46273:648-1400(-)
MLSAPMHFPSRICRASSALSRLCICTMACPFASSTARACSAMCSTTSNLAKKASTSCSETSHGKPRRRTEAPLVAVLRFSAHDPDATVAGHDGQKGGCGQLQSASRSRSQPSGVPQSLGVFNIFGVAGITCGLCGSCTFSLGRCSQRELFSCFSIAGRYMTHSRPLAPSTENSGYCTRKCFRPWLVRLRYNREALESATPSMLRRSWPLPGEDMCSRHSFATCSLVDTSSSSLTAFRDLLGLSEYRNIST